MHCHPMKGRAYYACRSTDTVEPCGKMIREDSLLPWAEWVLGVLDAYRDPDLGNTVAERLAESQPQAGPGALASLHGNLERLGQRFQWGHMAEGEYRAKWERLTALRADLLATQAAAVDTTMLPLGSLIEGWHTDDPRTRRDLLAVFF